MRQIELRKTGRQGMFPACQRVGSAVVSVSDARASASAATASPSSRADMKHHVVRTLRLAGFAVFVLLAAVNAARAQQISVSNALFELPNSGYATPEVDMWNTIPPQGSNEDEVGVFTNDPAFGAGAYITNCIGTQAAYMYSDPGLVLYQVLPATYSVGAGYQLITGIIGGPATAEYPVPANGAIMQMSLFYLSGTNMVTIGYTNVVNTTNTFSNIIQFVNFELDIPPVQSTNAWARKNIGVAFSTIVPNGVGEGGAWDLNNVQLFSTPCFLNPALSNGQFSVTFKSQPGSVFQILETGNLSISETNWTAIATVTNTSGTMPFRDSPVTYPARFYGAREYPQP